MRNDGDGALAAHGRTRCIAVFGAGDACGRIERHALAEIGCKLMDFDGVETLAQAMRTGRIEAVVLGCNDPCADPRELVQTLRHEGEEAVPLLLLLQPEHLRRCAALLDGPGISFALMPCGTRELVVRVAKALNLVRPPAHCPLSFGRYRFVPETHTAIVGGRPVRLTPKEFGLALFLFRHIGHFQHREAIFDAVWGDRPARAKARTMDMHITNLRRKLGFYRANGLRLSAARCFGYGLFRDGEEDPGRLRAAHDAMDAGGPAAPGSAAGPVAVRAPEYA